MDINGTYSHLASAAAAVTPGMGGLGAASAQLAAQADAVTSLGQKLKNHESKEELMKTAKQFEGVMLQQLFQAMDKTVDRSGFMGGGHAESMFRDMLYEKIGDTASAGTGKGLGIAQMIYEQLERFVPDTNKASSTPAKTPVVNYDGVGKMHIELKPLKP